MAEFRPASFIRFAGAGVLILALLAVIPGAAGSAGTQQGDSLFVDSAAVGIYGSSIRATVVRERFVTVNFGLLGSEPTPETGHSSVSETLTLNFFGDAIYSAVLERITPSPSGGFAWIGHVAGVENSQVILVVNKTQLTANVLVPPEFYEVRYAGNGVHVIYQIDQSAFPPEMEPTPVDVSQDVLDQSPQAPLADDGSTIDVLVAYTSSARQAAGGTSAMTALIDLAVIETNITYANSGVNQRLRLVHTVEVSGYSETGDLPTDVDRLRNTSDSYMDNVHSLRDKYGADLVSLIVENGDNYCGFAYIMTTVSAAFASSAFSVVRRDCATGFYIFGHELGHNMGARHDRYVDPTNNSPHGYNHGYVNIAAGFRTLMSYPDECVDNGVHCTLLPNWSNPSVTYNGVPTGIPEGQPNAADNRKTLNNTAYTVANFRATKILPRAYLPLVNTGIASGAGFNSQFNGSATGWEVHHGDWSVGSDYYSTPGVTDEWASTSYVADFTNLDYQAELWRYGCDGCANNLVIRGTPDPLDSADSYDWYSFYTFQYDRYGSYSVWKRVAGGEFVPLQQWTPTSAINQGDAWNTLRVVADNGNFQFYINGTLVWSGSDITLSHGRVGIEMYSDGTSGDHLYANYATLATSGLTSLGADAVSTEQRALNEQASTRAPGDERMAPRDN